MNVTAVAITGMICITVIIVFGMTCLAESTEKKYGAKDLKKLQDDFKEDK